MNETKELPCEFREQEGLISGYASVFDNVDLQDEVVERGAFRNSLARIGSMPILWCHEPTEPIGRWISGREDDRGLRVEGQLVLEVRRAKEVRALVKARAVQGLSIGYRVVKDRWDPADKVRRLLEVDLREISVVPFPANELATIETAKGEDAEVLDALLAALRWSRDAVGEPEPGATDFARRCAALGAAYVGAEIAPEDLRVVWVDRKYDLSAGWIDTRAPTVIYLQPSMIPKSAGALVFAAAHEGAHCGQRLLGREAAEAEAHEAAAAVVRALRAKGVLPRPALLEAEPETREAVWYDDGGWPHKRLVRVKKHGTVRDVRGQGDPR